MARECRENFRRRYGDHPLVPSAVLSLRLPRFRASAILGIPMGHLLARPQQMAEPVSRRLSEGGRDRTLQETSRESHSSTPEHVEGREGYVLDLLSHPSARFIFCRFRVPTSCRRGRAVPGERFARAQVRSLARGSSVRRARKGGAQRNAITVRAPLTL